jgi:4-amino-4-deoxy-L-arabinose transferase-like glycosyltransferase
VKGTPRASRWPRAIDPLIALALFSGYVLALVLTAHQIGYSRDEGFYFHAAGTYGRWFELLLSRPSRALDLAQVDRYWQENHEHPALMKSLFWLSERLFAGNVFHERGTSLRFPAMLISGLGVATTFAFGRRCVGRAAGVVAALSFALMPHVFHHAHLACFDMPVASLWLMVVYAYYRSLDRRAWGWAINCALLYGLMLDTKHNAWFLPPVLIAHALGLALLVLVGRFRRARPRLRVRLPLAIPLMLLLGPLVLYALWPWLWHDTWRRVLEWIQFHWQHVYYNMEYLGRTYFEPPFPRSYAWVMTLATVPAISLVLAAVGGCVAFGAAWRGVRAWWRSDTAADVAANVAPDGSPDPTAPRAPLNWASLWLLSILLGYAPWLLTTTPIFGGTKHWLGAYPFLALFAGQGFCWLASALTVRLPPHPLRRVAPWALAACCITGPLVMSLHSVPWGLSAYTPLVGGAPGAATLGLNRSFWGYTTGSVTTFLDQAMAPGGRLFLHDTAYDAFRMLQRDGRLRRDIKALGTVASSQFALYHHEQHMSRVEHMIWVDYGTTTPAYIATYDGVPMIWVYARP